MELYSVTAYNREPYFVLAKNATDAIRTLCDSLSHIDDGDIVKVEYLCCMSDVIQAQKEK